ncbi:hypothetical protein EW146_g249 [Bondarzewia mesenterica]|uniref:NADP-dependent oxidoreductase domain-containing protein n=1 Tax=Bondarzewia mesenterica TaxID=1095465 RepID=A0A4S4M7I6_9AGAM|nr:hypothetical protein EW146_g249 [Bondarzewia mesenterica]
MAEYRRLGKSGLRVSVPILGCMSFGDPRWNSWVLPEEKVCHFVPYPSRTCSPLQSQALPILKAAWDAGVTTLDTANMYSNGESETIIRNFINQYNIPRENMVIVTKIRFPVDHGQMSTITSRMRFELASTRDYVNQSGLSRTAIFNQTEASLKRLGMDYIDVLMIHMYDMETPFEETMRALHDLVLSGKVRYLGASNVRAWQFIEMNNVAQLNGWTQFSCVQMEHSLLYRAEERELFAYCDFKGIGIIAFSPLMDGHLARPDGTETVRTKRYSGTSYDKKRRECDIKIIQRVEEIAQKHSWKMCQVALAWSASKISSPIVGVNSVERLHEDIITGKTLTAEEIKYLEEPYEDQPPRF